MQIGKLWSLSLEEQFHLLWPSVFVLLGARRAGWVAASAVVIAPMARLAAIVLLKDSPYRDLDTFPMVKDCIVYGCLLALVGDGLVTKAGTGACIVPPAPDGHAEPFGKYIKILA